MAPSGERLRRKAGMVFVAGKTVWSMPERFKVVCIPCKALYKCSALLYFTLSCQYNNQRNINATDTRRSSWDQGQRPCLSPRHELCKCYQHNTQQLNQLQCSTTTSQLMDAPVSSLQQWAGWCFSSTSTAVQTQGQKFHQFLSDWLGHLTVMVLWNFNRNVHTRK